MNVSKLNKAIALCVPLIVFAFAGLSQTKGLTPELQAQVEQKRAIRAMFYNCENLFDAIDDSLTNDSEFLPESERHWSNSKYKNKLHNTVKVITAVGGWVPPELVGLCEIENRQVLNDLVFKTQLYMAGYKFVHRESPDARGIDVALLYNPKSFKLINTYFIKISYPTDTTRFTRDILHATGIISQTDTLHVFINHWPSRYGGQLESEDNRFYVASILRKSVDSLFVKNPNTKILIMGDFNDEPTDKSLLEYLKAKPLNQQPQYTELYNLTYETALNKTKGSHKYQGNWAVLDQIIVSGNLLTETSSLKVAKTQNYIFDAPFLLEPDEGYVGLRPFRTHAGFRYLGGYSDHLPIFVDFKTE